MSCHFATRAISATLAFTLGYSPVLGSFTGTVAAAQSAQTSTYQYQYDASGNLTQSTDPLGNVTKQTYDALDRVTQQVLPASVTGGATPAVAYAYDGQDQPTTITDPRSLVTRYAIDGLGMQTSFVSPDTGTASQTYDLNGNVATSTDARGVLITYSYDALNRLTRIHPPTGADTTFEYDGGATPIAAATGHLTKMVDASGQTIYTYNAFGRLLTKKQTVTNAAKSFQLSYIYGTTGTATGKLTGMTYPSGNRVNFSYDAAGHVRTMSMYKVNTNGSGTGAALTPLLGEIAYQPFGAPQSWTWGNSTTTVPNKYSRAFDLDGRVLSYPLGNAAAKGTLRTLGYDAAGRITSMAHTGSGTGTFAPAAFNQMFAYDNLSRLKSFTGISSQTFQYDANGNRTAVTFGATSYTNTVSTTSNRLASTTGPAPAKTNTYDNAGNLTSDATLKHAYDANGRRTQSTIGTAVVTYSYNGIGQRVSKASTSTTLVPGGLQHYVYDEAGHLIGEYDAAGAPVQETVYLGDIPVVVLKQTVASSVTSVAVYYAYTDQLAAPRVLTRSSDNQIVWRWDAQDPFGLQQPDANPSALGAFTYNLRFPGQMYDIEAKLHYNYFRDYDPQTGRYIQSDPIGLRGGINTYLYVSANPLFGTDPFGLEGPNSGWSKGVTNFTISPITILSYYSGEMSRLNIAQGSGSGPDNVFHCVAACKAKKAGNDIAYIRHLMNQKENSDYVRGRLGLYGDGRSRGDAEMTSDNDHDKVVNEVGLSCPANMTCEARCEGYVETLAPKSRTRMRNYLSSPEYKKY